jgi:2-amino-4-hydroxy-6-hydroxymethyldihydropteridine diphosphokinase
VSVAGKHPQSIAWIGLGSNIGDGQQQISHALKLLDNEHSVTVLRCSDFFCSSPMGVTGQRDYTNAVAEIECSCSPEQLFILTQRIENQMGRKRNGPRWGPRTIDLDILLYDSRILHLPNLTIPHPRMHKRAFVLIPIYDLEPDLLIPARGSVRSFLARLEDQGVRRLKG